MIDQWIWIVAAVISAGVVAIYWRAFRRHLDRDRARLAEARELGFDRPTGQFPHIDPALCIGCGACVAVCPEGDVLGMVGGQAVIVNGARCVGIAACEPACPVGAITVGLGSVRGRADLPVLDDERQTTVAGLYIAGELGGLSLVRNAVDQGRAVAHSVARRLEGDGRGRGHQLHDLLIVGAGPAGLSAALASVELGLDYVVLEQEGSFGGTIFHYPRRKLVHTQPVDLPLHGRLERAEHSKEELLELFEGLMRRHGLRIDFGRKLTSLRRENEGFVLEAARVGAAADAMALDGDAAAATDEGAHASEVYRARFVVLAIGRRGSPRRLDVPGEDLPKVMYQVRDAELYRDQRILCVGGGDSAVEAAMGLGEQPGNEVWISYRRERFGRIKRRNQERLDEAIEAGQVRPLLPSNLVAIESDCVRLDQGGREVTLANDYVFVLAGGEAPYAMVKAMGVRFGDDIN
jgi:thioredoxin reductase/ferredoxin